MINESEIKERIISKDKKKKKFPHISEMKSQRYTKTAMLLQIILPQEKQLINKLDETIGYFLTIWCSQPLDAQNRSLLPGYKVFYSTIAFLCICLPVTELRFPLFLDEVN